MKEDSVPDPNLLFHGPFSGAPGMIAAHPCCA
jgi:hypothetical protein